VAGVGVGRVLRNGVADIQVGRPAADRVVLIAGRISPEKGIEHALRSARAAGLGVRIAGAAYDPSYKVDMDGAEVMAVRWDEPFGLVAAEAQMAGCPVAAYRRGALPEVVEEGVSGVLADPDDIEGLARAIKECLDLDRRLVRSSARRRLGLEAALDSYEVALAEVAR
jgi:glycosyltransferase involved in cell wall biosynthesis